jgi:hypothetical protein
VARQPFLFELSPRVYRSCIICQSIIERDPSCAGYEIEVYDATTLKYERTWDLNNDVTGAGMIVLPAGS